MMRQAGVIRVETIEQLMDVAQIVSAQPLPKGAGVAVFSNSGALGKVVADSATAHGLGVEALVADLDLDAGMSLALPELERRLRETLARDDVHAAVVAFLPASGLTVEKIAGASPAARPGPGNLLSRHSPASWTRPSTWRAWWGMQRRPRRSRATQTREPPSQPCAAVVRYAEWAHRDQGLFADPQGCDAEAAHADLEAAAQGRPGRTAEGAGPGGRRPPAGALRDHGAALRGFRDSR